MLYILLSMLVLIHVLFLSLLLESDAVFGHLSSMLGVVASKINVVVSPLRATILQVHML